MSNLYWYGALAILGVSSTAYTIYKKRDVYKVSTLLVFYLFSASFTWIGEFVVLGLFNSYSYKPGVYPNPWAENLLGHLILNTTLYPAAAIITVAFSLSYVWIFLFSAFFTLSEYLFIKLRIYEQHWWRYYMTAIAVIVFILVARKWFSKIKQRCSGLTRAITFYFVALIIIHTPAPVLLLLGKQYYHVGFINNMFGDMYLSSIIFIFFYHLLESFLLVLFTCILKKDYWKILPFIISIIAQSIFFKMHILIIQDQWSFVYALLVYEIFIAGFVLVERYTLRQD